ncbi:MAG: hypothetical protein PHF81_05830 [Flavobacterium sp.]|nr:hypothetical protein [Flavobacterium sp.]
MIAIHNNLRKSSFQLRWVNYCKGKEIPYKLVDSFSNDIIEDLKDCDAFMWHFHQYDEKDILMAKQLIYSLEQSGKKVFPNFKTVWHFDDKLGQKYLLESILVPLVPTYVFLDKKEAINWANNTNFPKVFKLRGGAGSQNVYLIKDLNEANKIINKAFGKGFPQYNSWRGLLERYDKYSRGLTDFKDVLKGVVRLFWKPDYARLFNNERGYVYFQEFVPNNDSDIRIIVIDGKAFGIKRMTRENDFRASGSGLILYDKELIDERCVAMAFDCNKKLKAQCIAYDFVFDKNNAPLLIEISYGFANAGYDDCPGYWDENLNWHEGKFNPYGWMVDLMIK